MSRLIRIYTVCHSVIDLFYLNPYLQQWTFPYTEVEVDFKNSGMKGLTVINM